MPPLDQISHLCAQSRPNKALLLKPSVSDLFFVMEQHIDAFILIGGRSSRFGTDKAFAELDGKTLAVRAAQTVEAALSLVNVRFVVGDERQFGADLIFGLGRPVVADLRPGFGAWSGLNTALAYSASEWTFVFACDLPFISSDLIRMLAGLRSDDIDAVVPRQPDGRLQPLGAFYRRSAVLKEVESLLSKPHKLPAIAELFSTIETRIVEPVEYIDLPGSGEFFRNVNYTGDLPT